MKVVEAVLWAPRPKQSLAWSQRTQYSNNELELEIRQYCFTSTGAIGTITVTSPFTQLDRDPSVKVAVGWFVLCCLKRGTGQEKSARLRSSDLTLGG